jgi:hypothetical protein
MYEAAASCKDISRAPVTNWERLQYAVRCETRDVRMFCYGLAARTEQNTERTRVRYDVLSVDGPLLERWGEHDTPRPALTASQTRERSKNKWYINDNKPCVATHLWHIQFSKHCLSELQL